METFNTIIIGGGPGGTKAAEILAKAGKKVALVSNELGGECLNWGCIPTKVYLWTAELFEKISSSGELGIDAPEAKINWHKLKERRAKVVDKLKKNLKFTLEKAGVKIIEGKGDIQSAHEIKVTVNGKEEILQTENIIIATGSEANIPGNFTLSERVQGSHQILDIQEIPKRLLIIGGGVIGVEFASIFAALGTQVTISELADHLIPIADTEISKELERVFARKNIQIIKKSDLTQVEMDSFEKVLVAIGRKPSITALSLAGVGIKFTAKGIETNEKMQTNIPNIFAIGDVAGKSFLAYTAEREGRIAAETILGKNPAPLNYKAVPATIFSSPEVAFVGLTEQQVKEIGAEYVVGKALYSANAKALILGSRDGFAKVIVEKSSEKILGIHLIGEKASELIAEASLAISLGAKVQDFVQNLHGHPILGEVIKEACENLA